MLTTENEIKAGDVVKLKSGGPRMTVSGIEAETNPQNLQPTGRIFIHVYCFVKDMLYKDRLYSETLSVVDEESK